jgi:hypothetical protein
LAGSLNKGILKHMHCNCIYLVLVGAGTKTCTELNKVIEIGAVGITTCPLVLPLFLVFSLFGIVAVGAG